MKLILKLSVISLLLLPLVLVGLLALVVEERPILHARADLTPERIAHGKRVFDRYDPRLLRSGAITNVSLSQEDLDLAINYFANQFLAGVAGLEIDQGRARIEATWKLPANPLGNFLNVKLEIRQANGFPRIEQMMLGKLWIPGLLTEMLLKGGMATVYPGIDWQTLTDIFRHVSFEYQRMTVIYQWRDDLPGKLSGVLWSEQDQGRIEAYQRRLFQLTQGGKNSLELAALMRPLFQLAIVRHVKGEAIAENRALILVLAFYANQRDLKKLISSSEAWPRPIWRTVTLSGREDLAKHYLVSAMLAAYAGTPLADAVGLYKEIQDARGGSGFSFKDIAADRAGTRLGELAIVGESTARKIQNLMSAAQESDFMPLTADLPESMAEAALQHRFGNIQDERYRQMMENIERRIEALPVNRD